MAEIRRLLESMEYRIDSVLEAELLHDERESVKALVNKAHRMREKSEAERRLWHTMSGIERELWEAGYTYIAGIDEVGRGPLAGPVVSAAVILPPHFTLYGLNDSKQLTMAKREEFAEKIYEEALSIGFGWVGPEEIDRINILEATKKAMREAIAALKVPPQYLLIDALQLPINLPQRAIIGGDGKSISIAAASVVAKVERDRYMMRLAKEYPEYGFDRNMGYGTREHLEAIAKYGLTPVHRRSFIGKRGETSA